MPPVDEVIWSMWKLMIEDPNLMMLNQSSPARGVTQWQLHLFEREMRECADNNSCLVDGGMKQGARGVGIIRVVFKNVYPSPKFPYYRVHTLRG